MSMNWVKDIHEMHQKFGVHEAVDRMDPAKLRTFLQFRLNFLKEELLEETEPAIEDGDVEEIVDGLIDLCVVAIGTLDAFGVDAYTAWDRVLEANMSKEPGVKPDRPNPLGLPDMIKPAGWTAPEHTDNHGILPLAYEA